MNRERKGREEETKGQVEGTKIESDVHKRFKGYQIVVVANQSKPNIWEYEGKEIID